MWARCGRDKSSQLCSKVGIFHQDFTVSGDILARFLDRILICGRDLVFFLWGRDIGEIFYVVKLAFQYKRDKIFGREEVGETLARCRRGAAAFQP